jgi:AcrR family transcriptional regulator
VNRTDVVAAAVALADEIGIDRMTMRRLGEALGIEAMSLYNHVANKDDLLDGMIDAVFSEIELPDPNTHWRSAIRARSVSVRTVLARHRWAIGLMESRATPGAATLRHHDAVIGCLRAAGFSVQLTARAFSVIDSYVYGFVLQERGMPFDSDNAAEIAHEMLARFPVDQFPHLAEFAAEHVRPGYDYGAEFELGLDLVLDGVAAMLTT